MDLSKLTLEIFSKLEQKWLSSDCWSPSPKDQKKEHKVHVLSIDGGFGPEGLVAVQALVLLESLLQARTGNPHARIPDFFDLVAGTGLGGVLAALVTAPADDPAVSGKPLFSASEAAGLLLSSLPNLFRSSGAGLFRRRRSRRYSGKSFEGVVRGALRGLTLKSACRPLLVPCYDLNSSAPFVFSRADAAGSDSFDFELWAVCRATSATPGLFKPFELTSVDGKTACSAVDGGIVMSNPSAAAVTHVLHNRRDFPFVAGVEDIAVLSIGNGQPGRVVPPASVAQDGGAVMEIVLRGLADTVDQMMANAFCWNPADYVRIQTNGLLREEVTGTKTATAADERLRTAGERMLKEKGVETLPFGGKRLLAETNAQRIESFVRRMVGSGAATTVEEPLLLLPAPSPLREADAVCPLDDGR